MIAAHPSRVESSATIYATARSPERATELQSLREGSSVPIEVLQLDMVDEQSVQARLHSHGRLLIAH